MAFMLILLLITIFIVVIYIDKKSKYDNIIPLPRVNSNGDVHFYIPYYIWQSNKKACILERCYQGEKIYTSNATFVITHCSDRFQNLFLFEKEIICWVQPLNAIRNEENYIINQYSQGNNYLQLNRTVISNEIIEVKEYISNAMDIHIDEKNEILNILEKIIENNNIKKEEAESVLEIFNKYEPLLSLSTNIITLIQSFIWVK